MTTINKPDTNLIPFLFMGCWNEDDSPRDAVAKAISEDPIKKLVLGGDNVYPHKLRIGKNTDFTKVYNLKTLMDGVQMLHGKEIYAALGNHNVGGPMLKTQRGLNKTIWTMPARYYSVDFKDYSLIIIDSNLIDDETEYNTMKEWLKGTLEKLGGKPYFYVQHDPFVAFGKTRMIVFPKLKDLLIVLAAHPPAAVLCADTHNYQKGTLQIGDTIIQQYVVGTGGAHPDFVMEKDDYTYIIDDVTYKMETHIPGYGYLRVTPDSKGNGRKFLTEFVKVLDWRPFEVKGGKRRRIKKTHKRKPSRHNKSRKNTRK